LPAIADASIANPSKNSLICARVSGFASYILITMPVKILFGEIFPQQNQKTKKTSTQRALAKEYIQPSDYALGV